MRYKKKDIVKVVMNKSINKELDAFIGKVGQVVEVAPANDWPYVVQFHTTIKDWADPFDQMRFNDDELVKASEDEKEIFKEEEVENQI